ncbi:glycosyltransferase family 9 protein [Cytophaga hutchinsonii]|uniref:Glycosyltransferase, family 9 n=1 Tax=Cytophaga hutchinsonii (strain ATCC 33406 / DSM 1761 / CIP 103989 / NBRC 15051 / NCIMB 9469 / D465) TaxID=269798 RepID=A0A6N4SM91_CYTH3|nr:glycosyltransferase family 9 protein [Cytophaga hutchinsonii]ABG57374.1 glycosyltransferase, family 9 [Cytophaga hutchinsonii ATCC 33406]SFX47338.1 Glycosyltransferase family 9 (heptosyltransferase) [Cytophaga hutchinsonii ATCC 33406]
MKILILRFSSIGDIVLTTPVIRCLKKQIPNAEIHFATKASFKSILENNPYIDKLHLLESSTASFIKQLKAERFDVVIDLHSNIRTKRIKWALKAKSFTFDKLNIRKWFYVNWKWKTMPAIHIVDRYLDTVKHLGVKNDNEGLDYFIPEKDIISRDSLPQKYAAGYVAIAIGAQHATKRLPEAKLIELIGKISHPIILLGGKDDTATAARLVAYFPDTKNILNACGTYNLNQSASIVHQCMYLYTHDTGLMHIGAALQKRIISIWGNTTPELGMYAYKTEHVNWQKEDLYCRPCSKIGYNSCPKKHFRCMNEQVLPVHEIESRWN